jgi:hypothetical protein
MPTDKTGSKMPNHAPKFIIKLVKWTKNLKDNETWFF